MRLVFIGIRSISILTEMEWKICFFAPNKDKIFSINILEAFFIERVISYHKYLIFMRYLFFDTQQNLEN